LEYPVHLHDLHNDYPLAPEPKIVTDDMLSKHSSELKAKLKTKENLLSNLYQTCPIKRNMFYRDSSTAVP
jgi:hypothetical protein